VKVRRADEERVRQKHEQHEPARAAHASIRKAVKTRLQLLYAFPLVKKGWANYNTVAILDEADKVPSREFKVQSLESIPEL
jgi:hypothetical protein